MTETEKIRAFLRVFIDEMEAFDLSFFRISEEKAATINPQQRILLELLDKSCTNRVYTTLLVTSVASDGKTARLTTPNGLT